MKHFTTSVKISFLVFLTLALVFFIQAYHVSNEIVDDSFSEQVQNHYENIDNKLKNFHHERYKLLETLAQDMRTKLYLHTKNQNDIQNFFLSFAKAHPLIMQMRVLDLQGNELFRLNQENEQQVIVKEEALQNKAHRYYFQEFMKLKKDELGVSRLDLNVENKKIEIPFKPTVRLSMPVYENDVKTGLLIINYAMDSFLRNIFTSSFFNIYLVDSEGYFITHDKKAYEWSKYTNHATYQSYFQKDLPMLPIQSIDLWGSEFFILYQPKQNSSAVKFINYSQLIGLLLVAASVCLIFPFLYLLYSYLKKLQQTNSKLDETKKQVELILNHTYDSIILIDLKGHIQEVNLAALKTFGYKKSELLGQNINILIPEPHHSKHDEYLKNYNRSMSSKVINQNRELYGLHKSGRLISIRLTVTRVYIDNIEYFIGTIQDLSKEERTQKLFENIFSSASIGVALVLEDGHFWRVNPSFCKMIGYSEEELMKLTFKDITHPDELDVDMHLVEKILNKEIDNYTLNKRYISKTGEVFWVKLKVTGVFTDSSKKSFDYFIAIIDDISDQVENLKEAEEVAQIGHWHWRIEPDYFIVSDNMYHLMGKNNKDFENNYESFLQTIFEEDRPTVDTQIKQAILNKSSIHMYYRTKVNNEIRYIYAKAKVTYQGNIATDIFGISQDVTQLKKLEEEKNQKDTLLLQQSKLAAMGEMVGAIAHQWRQPLNAIGFIFQDLVSAYKHNEFNEEYLDETKAEVMEQLSYMSDTIDEFRNFFKKEESCTNFNLIDTIQDVHKLYAAQLKNNHLELLLTINNEPFSSFENNQESFDIFNQEGQLKQVLINCISNAKEMLDGKTNLQAKQKEIIVDLKLEENHFIISIMDLAGGIDKDIASRIFEPYFTTKELGTGLGLYICKTVCEQSLGGSISHEPRQIKIEEEIFEGSSFVISLPKTNAQTQT